MRTTPRRALRDRLMRQDNDFLPDGVGGTITAGPMKALDLEEILNRGAHGAGHGGAVSGAAHVVVIGTGLGGAPGIALSDGSTITFARVGDPGVLREDEASLLLLE